MEPQEHQPRDTEVTHPQLLRACQTTLRLDSQFLLPNDWHDFYEGCSTRMRSAHPARRGDLAFGRPHRPGKEGWDRLSWLAARRVPSEEGRVARVKLGVGPSETLISIVRIRMLIILQRILALQARLNDQPRANAMHDFVS
jgi:hypothetical protein